METQIGRFLVILMISLAWCTAAPPASAGVDPADIMPLSEVRPGQQAVGLSVFRGTIPDSFEIEILSILENVGPGRNIILGKARGQRLEKTGIVAGMSGSPVYVDGRLIGAMAYAWSFSTEPIVGITPIGEMIGILERSEKSPKLGLGRPPGEYGSLFLTDTGHTVSASEARQIQTPVVLAGFPGSARTVWQSFFNSLGFVGVEGAGTAPDMGESNLVPGSAVGITMVRGDMASMALGTVTWADGENVLAFGHAFLTAGAVSLPMAEAYIHTVLPSQVSSFKIGAPGKPAGAILQDRQAGILGVLGAEAPMLPVAVTVTSESDGERREYEYEIIRSDVLMPGLIGLVSFSSVVASEKAIGETTLEIKTEIRMDRETVLESDVVVGTTMPPSAVAEQIGWPIEAVVTNPFRKVEIEAIDVHIEVVDRLKMASIDDLRVGRTEVRPGEDLDVWITLRPYREPEIVKRVKLLIPPETRTGRLEIVACSSGGLWEREMEIAPLLFEPTSFDQLIELLGRRRSTQNVYLQVFQPHGGRVVAGRELPRLPGSVLSVVDSGTRMGRAGGTAGSVVIEEGIGTDWVIVGCKSVVVDVRPR